VACDDFALQVFLAILGLFLEAISCEHALTALGSNNLSLVYAIPKHPATRQRRIAKGTEECVGQKALIVGEPGKLHRRPLQSNV
jgi:hypothetical protein